MKQHKKTTFTYTLVISNSMLNIIFIQNKRTKTKIARGYNYFSYLILLILFLYFFMLFFSIFYGNKRIQFERKISGLPRRKSERNTKKKEPLDFESSSSSQQDDSDDEDSEDSDTAEHDDVKVVMNVTE